MSAAVTTVVNEDPILASLTAMCDLFELMKTVAAVEGTRASRLQADIIANSNRLSDDVQKLKALGGGIDPRLSVKELEQANAHRNAMQGVVAVWFLKLSKTRNLGGGDTTLLQVLKNLKGKGTLAVLKALGELPYFKPLGDASEFTSNKGTSLTKIMVVFNGAEANMRQEMFNTIRRIGESSVAYVQSHKGGPLSACSAILKYSATMPQVGDGGALDMIATWTSNEALMAELSKMCKSQNDTDVLVCIIEAYIGARMHKMLRPAAAASINMALSKTGMGFLTSALGKIPTLKSTLMAALGKE